MTHEVTNWKQNGCVTLVRVVRLSQREPHSREINEEFGEGGALNANYRTAEAIAKLSNLLGAKGFIYGTHFVWKTADADVISLDFLDPSTKRRAEEVLKSFV